MSLLVIRPGMLTTVQDLGRWGYQHSGVPVAGPMDSYSHRLANQILGNEPAAAALEVTLIGPELEASEPTTCVVQGARFDITVDGRSVDVRQPFVIPAGQRLRFGARRSGSRATVAVLGGFDLPTEFGSRATSLVSGIGPFNGRPLQAGDVLPVGSSTRSPHVSTNGRPLTMPDGGAILRVMRGPHASRFTPAAIEQLFTSRFRITPQSNRMGYRLEGPPLVHSETADILSDATPIGSLQVPSSGQPILLMADRQTTGGYPKIGTVITADLSAAGQLVPGDWIEFSECTRAEAIAALRAQEAALMGLSA
jgi:antagonist of KipI